MKARAAERGVRLTTLRRTNLILLSLSILLTAFSCFNVKNLAVQAPPRSGLTIEGLSADYSKATAIVRTWARERNLKEVDCGAFHRDREASPACRGFEFGSTRISVIFEPSLRRTRIEIFEGGSSQSERSKQAQSELRSRLTAEFGTDRLRDDIPW